MKEFGEHPRQNEELQLPEDRIEDSDEDLYTGENSSQQTRNKPMELLDLTQVLALLLIPSLLKAKAKLNSFGQNGTAAENPDQVTPQTPNERNNSLEDSARQISEETNNISFVDKSSHSAPDTPKSPRWAIRQSEKGDAHSPDADLIENVLEMMLHDATGNINPQPLTKDLLKQLLLFYGEVDKADNDTLLDEMILAASDGAAEDLEGNPIMLDKYAFAKALTNDVGLYNIENENKATTNYFDVFQSDGPSDSSKTQSEEGHDEGSKTVNTVWTFPSIDYTADTFRSKSFVILLWCVELNTYYLNRSYPLTQIHVDISSSTFKGHVDPELFCIHV